TTGRCGEATSCCGSQAWPCRATSSRTSATTLSPTRKWSRAATCSFTERWPACRPRGDKTGRRGDKTGRSVSVCFRVEAADRLLVANDLEAELFEHFVVGRRCLALGGQIVAHENRVGGVEAQRLQAAQVQLTAAGDADLAVGVGHAKHGQHFEAIA